MKIYEHNTNVEETINNVRLFDDDEPTEKGQSMSLSRWHILCDSIEIIDKNLEDVKKDKDVDYRLHLGGNVHVSVTSPYRCKHSQIQLHEECGVGQKDIIPNKRRSLPTNTGVGKSIEQLVRNKLSFTRGAGQCGAMLCASRP